MIGGRTASAALFCTALMVVAQIDRGPDPRSIFTAAVTSLEGIDVADTRRLPGPNADLWDWQLHAACRGMASSYFFHPEGERGPARARREAQAKAVCFECPAMAACRAHALQVHEPYGIWGGLSEGERAQMLALSAAH